MSVPALTFSDDQAEAYDHVTEVLRRAGVDLDEGTMMHSVEEKRSALAVVGNSTLFRCPISTPQARIRSAPRL